MLSKGIFITGTDTGVGKTIATLVIGVLLREQGFDVGVMKPFQCGGDDAEFLRKMLDVSDTLKEVNPYFADEALSPNIAFQRQGTRVNIREIIRIYEKLKQRHDFVLIEGAGGLLVPIKKKYLMADLVKELGLELIIVSRLGLGTINHTLLTVNQAREMNIPVRGVIFNESEDRAYGIPEKINPDIVKEYGKVAVIGRIPYFKKIGHKEILDRCGKKIDINVILSGSANNINKKTGNGNARRLEYWDKQYLWHPFTQMSDWVKDTPVIIEEAKGCYLIDAKGNRYLDGISSLWVNIHGHGKKEIDEAIKQQAARLSHSTMLGLSNTPAIKLAKALVEIAPKGLEKVFYSDSGSTAVEIAIKMAYQYWQNIGKTKKKTLVHLAGSYHGDTLGSVSIGGIDLFHKIYRGLIFKTIKIDFPDCYRSPRGKKYPEYAFECLKKFGRLLKSKHNSIAAFVVEPIVQGAAGMIVWPEGVLKEMSRLCQKYEIVFIVDEVATGFGRTGRMFACEHEGVSPDILCLAKGVTGGYLPLAATLTTQKIFNGFIFDFKDKKTFFHGHTYTGNPLCCAAALANIKIFKKENTLKKLRPKIKHLSSRLSRFYDLKHVGDVRQKGFMVGIELVNNRRTKRAYSWEAKIGIRVCQEARKRGVILRPLGNVIVLMPPLAISIKELNILLDVTYWAIGKITEGDF